MAAKLEFPAGNRIIPISNPDRVYFPDLGITKKGLADYYLAVSDGIVRALKDRPCTLVRYPEGIDGETFHQKRIPKGAPDWMETVHISFPSGRTADELRVTEIGSVIWAVQMSTIEFHPWPVRAADVDCPDELRIDLDPQPGRDYNDARRAAEITRELLAELGWSGWIKTSGKRGIHIAITIEPRWGFTEVRRACLAFARELERRDPELLTTAWWKEERGEKVFIDFNQNARDRTIVAGYSVRGNSRATVSAPISWDELADANPEDFTVQTMPSRFAELGDPHAGRDTVPAVSIEPLLEWSDRDAADHGLQDAPYPPNYPKMPGEPLRVQPSKARN